MRKLRGHLFVPSNRGNRFKSLFCGCTDESDEFAVFEAIANREGSREMFRNHSGEYLLETLDDFLHFHSVGNEVLRRRLADLGVRIKEPDLRYVVTSDLEYLGRLIAIGFDPRAVSKKDLYGLLHIGTDDRSGDVYAKSTFDALVARGFAFDEADLIVLDERMEPALEDLSALIRGENR